VYYIKTLSAAMLISATSLLIPSTVLAVSQSYIEAVKLDMQESETKTWQQPSDSEWFPSGEESGTDSMDSFQTFLQTRFPSSYLLFKKLDEGSQQQVWKNYIKTGNLGGIRSDVYSLWKQSKRKRLGQ
jgi:hypothetical protein